MGKRLLRLVATLAALVVGYVGYVRGFALILDRVAAPQTVPILPDRMAPSLSQLEANELARQAFGPGHWAINTSIQYYDSYRGFWMFAGDYEPQDNGKKLVLKPFALIWRDRQGKALKTLAGESATLVFNKAPLMNRAGGGEAQGPGADSEDPHVAFARIEGEVSIRDDKGTPRDLGDDLTIGPLAFLEFDESKSLIRTDQPVVIRDRDTMATAQGGVEIHLLPRAGGAGKGATGGYDGARSLRLLGAVRITAADVGGTGLVPGGVSRSGTPGSPRVPRPGEITCDDGLIVELPALRKPVLVGPPAPPSPTQAYFSKNVRVRQGDAQTPEQLDCTKLHLVLVPAERGGRQPASPPAAEVAAVGEIAVAEAEASRPAAGPVSGLSLKRARAIGHAVWLQSKAQGVVAVGNELVYERRFPAGTDTTYFRAEQGRFTEIRKENPTDGTLDVIRTYDLTVHHEGASSAVASIIAGGPGLMETRRVSDQSVMRSASWQTRLVMQPVENDPTRRQITLEGKPMVNDPAQGKVTSTEALVAVLASKDAPPAGSAAPGGAPAAPAPTGAPAADAAVQPTAYRAEADLNAPATTPAVTAANPVNPLGGGTFRIELIRAWRDVELVTTGAVAGLDGKPAASAGKSPDSPRTIRAREMLVARFDDPTGSATLKRAPAAPAPVQAPAEAGSPAASPAGEPAETTASKPPAPPLSVAADKIWAWIDLSPGAASKGDVREVRLRGNVLVHQDPQPGKPRGLDVSGEQVDLIGQGQAVPSGDGAGLANRLFQVRAQGLPDRPARISSEAFELEGQSPFLDQAKNFGCVLGDGKLVQYEAGGNVLGDGLDGAPRADDAPGPKKPRGPLTITWGRDAQGQPLRDAEGRPIESWMKFYGASTDSDGRPGPALADFYNGVRAWTEDSSLVCGQMTAFFDAPIDFRKVAARPGGNGRDRDAAPKPRISRVECDRDVEVVSRRLDDAGNVLDKQRVLGQNATYELASNTFRVDSAGQVYLYSRQNSRRLTNGGGAAPPMAGADRSAFRPVAADERDAGVVRRAGGAQAAPATPLKPLELTRITFEKQMIGQLNARGTPADAAAKSGRAGQAEFFGNVQTMHAPVPDDQTDLDPDRLPPQAEYFVSSTLRVISEPPPPGSTDSERILIQAWGGSDGIYALNSRPGEQVAIRADRMNYDSATGLSILYGGPNGVLIASQSSPGQPASYGSGSMVQYNHKTGENRVLDARSIAIADPRSGARASTPPVASAAAAQPKKKRTPFPAVPSANKERRNFTGR